jgi:hypothetical protein
MLSNQHLWYIVSQDTFGGPSVLGGGMEAFEQQVWRQYRPRCEGDRPAASSVSTSLQEFPALCQRQAHTQDEVGFVLRYAMTRDKTLAAVDASHTSVELIRLDGGAASAVSTGEWFLISGVPHLRVNEGRIRRKQWESWLPSARQFYNVPGAEVLKNNDWLLWACVDQHGPVPT